MSTKKDVSIQSAHTVSVLRALAVKEKDPAVQGSDYLAENFLTTAYKMLVRMPHRLVKAFVQFRAPGSYCFMITRTKHFDQTLVREIDAGIRQVVLLGAGYDTRPFRFADQLANVSVFEVDFPGTQLYKKKKLAEISRSIPANITFIPVDFNEDAFDEALIRQGFNPQLKTLFLWEGVSYYLPQMVVQQVLTFVSTCVSGSSILFDYATKDFVDGDLSSYGGKKMDKWLKKIKEPFLFGMNANETPRFLQNCKLLLTSDYGPDDVERMYLRTSTGQSLGKPFGHVRMAHARVQ